MNWRIRGMSTQLVRRSQRESRGNLPSGVARRMLGWLVIVLRRYIYPRWELKLKKNRMNEDPRSLSIRYATVDPTCLIMNIYIYTLQKRRQWCSTLPSNELYTLFGRDGCHPFLLIGSAVAQSACVLEGRGRLLTCQNEAASPEPE